METMKWIDVNEKLPQRGKEVLVYGYDKTMSIRYRPYKSKCGDHVGDDGMSWFPDGWPVNNTTHWMKLPKPPICTCGFIAPTIINNDVCCEYCQLPLHPFTKKNR